MKNDLSQVKKSKNEGFSVKEVTKKRINPWRSAFFVDAIEEKYLIAICKQALNVSNINHKPCLVYCTNYFIVNKRTKQSAKTLQRHRKQLNSMLDESYTRLYSKEIFWTKGSKGDNVRKNVVFPHRYLSKIDTNRKSLYRELYLHSGEYLIPKEFITAVKFMGNVTFGKLHSYFLENKDINLIDVYNKMLFFLKKAGLKKYFDEYRLRILATNIFSLFKNLFIQGRLLWNFPSGDVWDGVAKPKTSFGKISGKIKTWYDLDQKIPYVPRGFMEILVYRLRELGFVCKNLEHLTRNRMPVIVKRLAKYSESKRIKVIDLVKEFINDLQMFFVHKPRFVHIFKTYLSLFIRRTSVLYNKKKNSGWMFKCSKVQKSKKSQVYVSGIQKYLNKRVLIMRPPPANRERMHDHRYQQEPNWSEKYSYRTKARYSSPLN